MGEDRHCQLISLSLLEPKNWELLLPSQPKSNRSSRSAGDLQLCNTKKEDGGVGGGGAGTCPRGGLAAMRRVVGRAKASRWVCSCPRPAFGRQTPKQDFTDKRQQKHLVVLLLEARNVFLWMPCQLPRMVLHATMNAPGQGIHHALG